MKTNIQVVFDLIMKNTTIEKGKLESVCKYLKESKYQSYHFLSLSSFCDLPVKTLKSIFRHISYTKGFVSLFASIDCQICKEYVESVIIEPSRNYYQECPHCGRDVKILNRELIEDYCSTFKIV